MKTLVVYHSGSINKFEEVFNLYTFSVEDSGELLVHRRDPHTGEESIKACFKSWEYFMIEE